jgi:hypothetical protein
MPQYLISFNDEWVAPHTADELKAKSVASRSVVDDMVAAGIMRFSDGGLDRSSVLCSVEAVDGQPVFSDGPYVESKEHLGGFAVIEVPDDETARMWAGRLAVALEWPQEVQRFPTFEQLVESR